MTDHPNDPLAAALPGRIDEETRATLDRVATSLARSAEAQAAVAKELEVIGPDLRRGLRASWLALAALFLVVVVAIGGGATWAYLYARGACERGNDLRGGQITASEVIIYEAARDLESESDARERSRRVAARVAEDPRLAPREC